MIVFFLWKSVYTDRSILFGYTNAHMQTYVFLSTLLVSVVLSTRLPELASEIINGDIISKIIKPFPIMVAYAVRDAADKSVNVFFALIEGATLLFLFRPPFYIQTDILSIVLSVMFLVLGICLSFYINTLLSYIGFWSNDVWAPRFIYFILITFLAGSYFPLDVLPAPIYIVLLLTPFPYLFYLPAKILIQGFGSVNSYIFVLLIVSAFWLFFLKYISRLAWSNAMKSYSFFGR
jgi:ABC-2 type transport system permease protein